MLTNSWSERMDIREIARRAKVSTATVSRAINHVPTVDPQLAKRVWKIVDELGYFPNTQARALVSGRSRIFGLIVSEITNPFFPGDRANIRESRGREQLRNSAHLNRTRSKADGIIGPAHD